MELINEGNVVLFRPESDEEAAWLKENVADDATYFGRALVVEHRYAGALAEGVAEAGFDVH